jgi:hypothetical protein
MGIAGMHNQYKGDTSLVIGDAYLNGGRVQFSTPGIVHDDLQNLV